MARGRHRFILAASKEKVKFIRRVHKKKQIFEVKDETDKEESA